VSGAVAWFTGLPSSGKSTLARRVRARLLAAGVPVVLLDGDEVRGALFPALGYTPAERDAFYQALGRLAALLAGQGQTVLVAATAHRRAHSRDPGGLWAAARAGQAPHLPGSGTDYEPPESPRVVAAGGLDDAALEAVVEALKA
jgi:adenylylsulfate kinase